MVNNKENDIKNKNDTNVRCPKCGEKLRRISEDRIQKFTGITEYDTYCDKCDITVYIEDRSAFEQEGKILITFT